MNKIKYIIVGHERSGTSITHHFLYNHPNVSSLYDEVNYKPFFNRGISTFTHGMDKIYEKEKGYEKIFDSITSLNQNEHTLAWGIKTAINKVEAAKIFVETVQKYFPKHKIIIIHRKNIIDLIGSVERAKKTGYWHSWQKKCAPAEIRFIIQPSYFTRFAFKSINIYNELFKLKSSHDVLIFDYEKHILPNDVKYFDKLCVFLGIPSNPIDLPLKKISTETEKYLINYKELLLIEQKIKNGIILPNTSFTNKIMCSNIYNKALDKIIFYLHKLKINTN